MRRRQLYLLLGAILLLGLFLYAVFAPSSEPSYGGRTLSQWVEMNAVWWKYNTPEALQQKAMFSKAISEMGTNAVPHLVKWIQYEEPSWKRALRDFFGRSFPA